MENGKWKNIEKKNEGDRTWYSVLEDLISRSYSGVYRKKFLTSDNNGRTRLTHVWSCEFFVKHIPNIILWYLLFIGRVGRGRKNHREDTISFEILLYFFLFYCCSETSIGSGKSVNRCKLIIQFAVSIITVGGGGGGDAI